MPAQCYPISRALIGSMLRRLVDSICDRPGETAMSQAAWEDEVAEAVRAFAPRDAVEFMLAGMIVSNYQLMLEATHEAFAGDATVSRGRGNPGIVALERAVTGLLKELRIAQARPLADQAQVSAPGVKTQPAGGATPKPEANAAPAPGPNSPGRDEPSSRQPAERPAAAASNVGRPLIDIPALMETMSQCIELGANRPVSPHPAAALNPVGVPVSTGGVRAGAKTEPVD
jgi:hypothetical protein